MAKMEHQQLAQGIWWIGLGAGHFYLLPIIAQRNLQLPGLLPPFDSIAQGDPCVGQIIGRGVVIGGDHQLPRQRHPGQPRQTEIRCDGQLPFAFSL